jgi:hypothetical protein
MKSTSNATSAPAAAGVRHNPMLNYTDLDPNHLRELVGQPDQPLTETTLSGMTITQICDLWRKKEVFHTQLKQSYLNEQEKVRRERAHVVELAEYVKRLSGMLRSRGVGQCLLEYIAKAEHAAKYAEHPGYRPTLTVKLSSLQNHRNGKPGAVSGGVSEPSTRAPSESVSRSVSHSASRETSPVTNRNAKSALAPIPEEGNQEKIDEQNSTDTDVKAGLVVVGQGNLFNENTCPGIDGEELTLTERKQLPPEQDYKPMAPIPADQYQLDPETEVTICYSAFDLDALDKRAWHCSNWERTSLIAGGTQWLKMSQAEKQSHFLSMKGAAANVFLAKKEADRLLYVLEKHPIVKEKSHETTVQYLLKSLQEENQKKAAAQSKSVATTAASSATTMPNAIALRNAPAPALKSGILTRTAAQAKQLNEFAVPAPRPRTTAKQNHESGLNGQKSIKNDSKVDITSERGKLTNDQQIESEIDVPIIDESAIIESLDFAGKQFRKMYLSKGSDSPDVRNFMNLRPEFKDLKKTWDDMANARVSSKNLPPAQLAHLVSTKLEALNQNGSETVVDKQNIAKFAVNQKLQEQLSSPYVPRPKHSRASMPVPSPPVKAGNEKPSLQQHDLAWEQHLRKDCDEVEQDVDVDEHLSATTPEAEMLRKKTTISRMMISHQNQSKIQINCLL